VHIYFNTVVDFVIVFLCTHTIVLLDPPVQDMQTGDLIMYSKPLQNINTVPLFIFFQFDCC